MPVKKKDPKKRRSIVKQVCFYEAEWITLKKEMEILHIDDFSQFARIKFFSKFKQLALDL